MFMYTPEGNKQVAKAVKALKGAIRFELLTTHVELANAVNSAFAVVARTHPEVYDTEPREYIHQQVIDAGSQKGWLDVEKYQRFF